MLRVSLYYVLLDACGHPSRGDALQFNHDHAHPSHTKRPTLLDTVLTRNDGGQAP